MRCSLLKQRLLNQVPAFGLIGFSGGFVGTYDRAGRIFMATDTGTNIMYSPAAKVCIMFLFRLSTSYG